MLVLLPERVDTDAHRRFADPDYVRYLGGDQRTRTTTLYRDGELKRILTVSGTRIHHDPTATGPVRTRAVPRAPSRAAHRRGDPVTDDPLAGRRGPRDRAS